MLERDCICYFLSPLTIDKSNFVNCHSGASGRRQQGLQQRNWVEHLFYSIQVTKGLTVYINTSDFSADSHQTTAVSAAYLSETPYLLERSPIEEEKVLSSRPGIVLHPPSAPLYSIHTVLPLISVGTPQIQFKCC